MKIFTAFKISALRSIKLWRQILIFSFLLLLLSSISVLPLKRSLKYTFGDSMLTERISERADVETIIEIFTNYKGFLAGFSSLFFLTIVISFMINTFLSGGFFSMLKDGKNDVSTGEFFKRSAENFWSFLGISLIVYLLIVIAFFLSVILPLGILSQNIIDSDNMLIMRFIIVSAIFSLILILLFLIADYSRAYKVSDTEAGCFKALGFGFKETFRTFFTSISLMILILIIQILLGLLAFKILSPLKPDAGNGFLGLFLISQLFVLVRVVLKVWRYGCITALMELNKSTDFVDFTQDSKESTNFL